MKITTLATLFLVASTMSLAGAARAEMALDAAPQGFAANPNDQLLGALAYTGGFQMRVKLDLAAPQKVARFRLVIPAFCVGVEILESGTVSEGVEDIAPAVRGSKDTFVVNGGAGQRISAVFATFNGPASSQCQIPVLTADADDPTDPGDPSNCIVAFSATQTLTTNGWPVPVWPEFNVQNFLTRAQWSLPGHISLPSDHDFLISNTFGSCYSYLRIKYDSAACQSNLFGDNAQTVFMGEVRDGTAVERLFALKSVLNNYNVCVLGDAGGVRFYHTL